MEDAAVLCGVVFVRGQLLAASDALLLGRVTYEGFAAAWPNMMRQYKGPRRAALGEYADITNGYPKYVASGPLEEPLGWNNSTLIQKNVAEEVSRLKQQRPVRRFDIRQWRARERADATRPHRRVPTHALSRCREEREASLQVRQQ